MIRTQHHLPRPQLRALRALARSRDVPVAALVRRAIEEFLRREAKPAPALQPG